MNLYHGTDLNSAKSICNNQIDVAIGSKHVDFGQGFYTTDDATQAKKWAKRKAKFRNGRAALVTVLFDEKKAASYIERFSSVRPSALPSSLPSSAGSHSPPTTPQSRIPLLLLVATPSAIVAGDILASQARLDRSLMSG